MITLYELHWSHYCEKIRWALDYKSIPWKKVEINAFTKEQLKKYPCKQKRYLVPFIYDEKNKISLDDSTPILRYIEKAYPDTPSLFPQQKKEEQLVTQLLIELDSILGVIARKLGYSQLILENPRILPQLFLPKIYKGIFTWPFIRNISGFILGMLLIKRFRLELNETFHLYEEIEFYLLPFAEKLKDQNFLFNNTFTAADITLAVYLRPLRIIPFFIEHTKLCTLFDWQEKLFREHNLDPKLLYEILLDKHRKKHSPIRRKIKNRILEPTFYKNLMKKKEDNIALNDHEPIWTWRILCLPYYYFVKLRENKK